MTEVTNELMYEVLKQIQDRLTALERKVDEVKSEIQAVRIHSLAMQQDIQNIYSILVRHDARLDRIERRLEIAEAPA
jgi:tetrahydromethanopterin S-methyltransferase subunit G